MATVIASVWDHNGSYHLSILTVGARTPAMDAKVRRAARAVDPMGLIQWTRFNRVYEMLNGEVIYNVTASRLGREYR